MKKVFLFLFLCFSLFSFAQDVWVNGYYRSNGTYVEGHYRTPPNNTINDNYSTQGNINPYTGKHGTVPREPEIYIPSYPNHYETYNSIPSHLYDDETNILSSTPPPVEQIRDQTINFYGEKKLKTQDWGSGGSGTGWVDPTNQKLTPRYSDYRVSDFTEELSDGTQILKYDKIYFDGSTEEKAKKAKNNENSSKYSNVSNYNTGEKESNPKSSGNNYSAIVFWTILVVVLFLTIIRSRKYYR